MAPSPHLQTIRIVTGGLSKHPVNGRHNAQGCGVDVGGEGVCWEPWGDAPDTRISGAPSPEIQQLREGQMGFLEARADIISPAEWRSC